MTLEEWLADYPQSPLGVLATLVAQFRSGERDAEAFEQSLSVFDEFLNEWAETLGQEEDASGLGNNLMLALQGLADAASGLREYAESGDDEVAQSALALAMDSQELLLDLMTLTQEQGFDL